MPKQGNSLLVFYVKMRVLNLSSMIHVDYNYLQNIVAITTISAIFFYGNRKTNSVPAYAKTRPDRKRSWTPETKKKNDE